MVQWMGVGNAVKITYTGHQLEGQYAVIIRKIDFEYAVIQYAGEHTQVMNINCLLDLTYPFHEK